MCSDATRRVYLTLGRRLLSDTLLLSAVPATSLNGSDENFMGFAALHCVQPGSPLRVIILLQRDAILRLSKAQDNLIPLGERQNACLAMHFHRFN